VHKEKPQPHGLVQHKDSKHGALHIIGTATVIVLTITYAYFFTKHPHSAKAWPIMLNCEHLA
jgi:hypothetical protein